MTEQCLSFCRLTLGAMLFLTNGMPLRAQAAPKCASPANPIVGSFLVCDATYALCTTATCEPIKGGGYSCGCNVMQGPSAGSSDPKSACSKLPHGTPTAGMQIPSRYYPIRSYVSCPISKREEPRGWAMCLDAPCVVDTNTSTARCTCKKQTAEPYVFTTEALQRVRL